MRMLVIVRLGTETVNAAVRDGTAGSKMNAILDEVKPEAVYFTEINGQRTVMMIVDLPKASGIPALAEPWFLTFNAVVELHPVMSPQDLQEAGLDTLGKKWA
jgi:hypothetical protein